MSARRLVAAAVALAGLVVVGAPVARAQAPGAGPGGGPGGLGLDVDYEALTKAANGAWADYQVTVQNKSDMPKVRYALVDRTPKSLSLEVEAPTPKGELDMRFDFAPQGADAWAPKSGKMKLGTESQEIPSAEVQKSPPLKKGTTPGDLVGTEDVVTSAGTFSCKHYRRTMPGTTMAMDFWMNTKVAPTGLVKSTIGPMTMVLAATGGGAKAKVN